MVLDIENVVINLDSNFRNLSIYPKSSKFIIDLENPLKNIISIRLSSIELPNLFYTFNSFRKSNFFFLNNKKITIESGNYRSSQIVDAIKKLLPEGITISFDDIAGKITFSRTDKNNFTLSFENDSIYPSLGAQLGFQNSEYINNNTYTGESILDVIGDNYVFLKINDFGRVINFYDNNIYFAKIILNQNKNIMIFDNFSNFVCKTYKFIQPVNISRLNIELVDLYGNTIDLNNLNFSFTLEIERVLNYYTKVQAENNIFNNVL